MYIKIGLLLFLTSFMNFVSAQNTTYQRLNPDNGSSSTISIHKTGSTLQVNILSRLNDPADTYGQFTGTGDLEQDQAQILSRNSDCTVKLRFTEDRLDAEFANCNAHQINPQFSGTYTKLADQIIGDYEVSTNISYFYSKPDLHSRKKGFLKAGDHWQIEEIFPGNWVFATIRSNDKTQFGYIRLQDLRFVKTYLFD